MISSSKNNHRKLRIALLDLYAGQPNEGMRCIRQLLKEYCRQHSLKLQLDEFDVRLENQVPDLSYDIYISSGGPGSPLESKGSEWEEYYFSWLMEIETWNKKKRNPEKKYVLLICHSFEIVCRQYKLAKVRKRKSMAFGVFPTHLLTAGKGEPLFEGLSDPFYAVDSRSYQVVMPDYKKLERTGASLLAIEKERPHVPLERSVMAIRFNPYMIGTQFHPEADAVGTIKLLKRKKKAVIAEHGEAKWQSMIDLLNDPDKITTTCSHIIPNFLHQALNGA
jgi:GMP synthase-like glutamine amidotransferase